MSFLQYVEMNSFLHRLDPRTKFVFFLAMAILTSVVKNGATILLLLVFFIVIWTAGRVTRYMLILMDKIKVLLIFISLFWVIMGAFTVDGGPVIFASPMSFPGGITLNLCFEWFDIYKGALLAVRVYLMISSFYTVIISTNFSQIILGLRGFRIPYSVAFGIGLVFQLIPIIVREFFSITQAQSSRGLEIEKIGALKKIQNYVTVSFPLLFRVLAKGHSIALAMYYYKLDFSVRRGSYKLIRATYRDTVFLMITAIIFAASIYLSFTFSSLSL